MSMGCGSQSEKAAVIGEEGDKDCKEKISASIIN